MAGFNFSSGYGRSRAYSRPGFKSRGYARQRPRAGTRPLYMGSMARRKFVPRTAGWIQAGEMKHYDAELPATAIPASTNWTGTEFPPTVSDSGSDDAIFSPDSGGGSTQRLGKKCTVYKIKIKGLINVPAQANQTAADNGTAVRVALVQDTQTNGAQAQGESIFKAPTTVTALQALTSFQDKNFFGRFKVLKDKTFHIQPPNKSYDGTNIEVGGCIIPFKWNITFKKPVVVNLQTGQGSLSSIVDNGWTVYANCTDTGLAPTLTYSSRVSFKG